MFNPDAQKDALAKERQITSHQKKSSLPTETMFVDIDGGKHSTEIGAAKTNMTIVLGKAGDPILNIIDGWDTFKVSAQIVADSRKPQASIPRKRGGGGSEI